MVSKDSIVNLLFLRDILYFRDRISIELSKTSSSTVDRRTKIGRRWRIKFDKFNDWEKNRFFSFLVPRARSASPSYSRRRPRPPSPVDYRNNNGDYAVIGPHDKFSQSYLHRLKQPVADRTRAPKSREYAILGRNEKLENNIIYPLRQPVFLDPPKVDWMFVKIHRQFHIFLFTSEGHPSTKESSFFCWNSNGENFAASSTYVVSRENFILGSPSSTKCISSVDSSTRKFDDVFERLFNTIGYL